jgi:molybdopterin-guanine dinucleotide biosynthesis protein A
LDISCIVLAGGKGLRLGRYKALVEVDGESLLQRVVSRLSFLDSDIIIVIGKGSKPPKLTDYTKLRIVTDAYAGKGPLVGIYTGLLASDSFYNLVVACDMPFLNQALIRYMLGISSGFDLVIPRVGEMVEPLHAVYSKDCLTAMSRLIEEGNFKIDRFFSLVKARYVEAEEIERFDPEHLSFFNINSEADLKQARELINRVKPSSSLCSVSDRNCSQE